MCLCVCPSVRLSVCLSVCTSKDKHFSLLLLIPVPLSLLITEKKEYLPSFFPSIFPSILLPILLPFFPSILSFFLPSFRSFFFPYLSTLTATTIAICSDGNGCPLVWSRGQIFQTVCRAINKGNIRPSIILFSSWLHLFPVNLPFAALYCTALPGFALFILYCFLLNLTRISHEAVKSISRNVSRKLIRKTWRETWTDEELLLIYNARRHFSIRPFLSYLFYSKYSHIKTVFISIFLFSTKSYTAWSSITFFLIFIFLYLQVNALNQDQEQRILDSVLELEARRQADARELLCKWLSKNDEIRKYPNTILGINIPFSGCFSTSLPLQSFSNVIIPCSLIV